MKRLLMMDAHPVLRNFARVAESYEDGLPIYKSLAPDLVVIDLAVPRSQHSRERVRVDDLRYLRLQRSVPVIALYSSSVSLELALLMLHEGTLQALLDKDALAERLCKAERAVLQGQRYAYFQGRSRDVGSLLAGLDIFAIQPEQAYLLSLLSEKADLRHVAERVGCSESNAYLLLQKLATLFRVPHFEQAPEAAGRMGFLSGGKVVSLVGVRKTNKSISFASSKTPPSALFLGHSFTSGARTS